MNHHPDIPDALWDFFGRSGSNVRNVLWETMAAKTAPAKTPPVVAPVNGERPWGTLFITRKSTTCPLCSSPIPPRLQAVQTSWSRIESGKLGRGPGDAVHVECAVERDIEVRWSVERIFSDLRQSIAGIEHRKLQRKP